MTGRLPFILVLAATLLSQGPALADPTVERLMDQGHWRRARVLAEQKLQAAPGDPIATRQMTRILQMFDDVDGAVTMGEKAVKLAPNDAAAHFALAQAVGEKAQNASKFKQLGLAKRFKKEAETVIALDPRHVEARLDLMSYYWQAPGIVGGDKKKAKALVEEVERIAPDQAWQAKARYADLSSDTSAYGAIYRDAAARNPNDYRAQSTYAGWMTAPWRATPAQAEAQARVALAIDPERIGAYTVLAVLQARQKHWDELERTLAEARAKIPDDLTPVYQSGRVCLSEHADGVRAEKYFREYLSHPPEANTASLAAARWRLGLALEKQGKKSEAIAEMQTATRLDPNFEPVKKDLKRLKG